MEFRSLEINHWRQFEKVKVDFHENLTILTGANGSGKTTLLNLLGKHFNWNVDFVSTPNQDEDTGKIQYLNGLFENFAYQYFK